MGPLPTPSVDRDRQCKWMFTPAPLVSNAGLNHDTLMVFSMSSALSDVRRVDRAGAPDLQVRTNDIWQDSGCLPCEHLLNIPARELPASGRTRMCWQCFESVFLFCFNFVRGIKTSQCVFSSSASRCCHCFHLALTRLAKKKHYHYL